LRAIRPRVSWQTPWLTDVPLRGRIPRSHACATRHIPLSFTFFPAVSLLVGILSALAASQPPLTQRRAACRSPPALWPLSSIGSASSALKASIQNRERVTRGGPGPRLTSARRIYRKFVPAMYGAGALVSFFPLLPLIWKQRYSARSRKASLPHTEVIKLICGFT